MRPSTFVKLGSVIALVLSVGSVAEASSFKVLYSFTGGSDGANPNGELLPDSAGNLYGLAAHGGDTACNPYGCGVVYKIAPDGTETVLYTFKGPVQFGDAYSPQGPLIRDKEGTFYGTSTSGGTGQCSPGFGCGIAFKLTLDGTETILHRFQRLGDGGVPIGGLVISRDRLFGVTSEGGHNNSANCGPFSTGCATLFSIKFNGKKATRYSFQGGADGSSVQGGLVADPDGNLYGTAVQNSTDACKTTGCGTLFKFSRAGVFSVLHAFSGGADGTIPMSTLMRTKAGDLYGTTSGGGGSLNCDNGCGTVFKLTAGGAYSVLYAFHGGADGASPQGKLVSDNAGNLYGITSSGGSTPCNCGTIFKLTPDGQKTVLYSFQGGPDGSSPSYGLTLRKQHLYGTAYLGGKSCAIFGGCGLVFSFRLPH
jgi:uncharacterized repeat protein (TIGR03803 family)